MRWNPQRNKPTEELSHDPTEGETMAESAIERVINLADQEWWTTGELARRLKVSKSSLEHWRSYGGGPSFYRVGQQVRYSRASVEAWLANRTFAHTSQYPQEMFDRPKKSVGDFKDGSAPAP